MGKVWMISGRVKKRAEFCSPKSGGKRSCRGALGDCTLPLLFSEARGKSVELEFIDKTKETNMYWSLRFFCFYFFSLPPPLSSSLSLLLSPPCVARPGLEPGTFGLWIRRSNQLSYLAMPAISRFTPIPSLLLPSRSVALLTGIPRAECCPYCECKSSKYFFPDKFLHRFFD